MMIGRILTWFYCLDLEKAALLVLLAAGVFRWMKGRWGDSRWFSRTVGITFLMWLAGVVFVTVWSRESGGDYPVKSRLLHSYREVLSGGNIEILRSNFMNGVLFFPGGVLLGALLPRNWSKWSRILLGVVLLTLLSAGVEQVQYLFQLGRVEADDVLHNALGALLGLLFGVI